MAIPFMPSADTVPTMLPISTAFSILLCLVGYILAISGAKFHEHWFRYVTAGVVGVFGSLLVLNTLFPHHLAVMGDDIKVAVSVFIGGGCWFVSMQVEEVIMPLYGIGAGGALGTILFNIVTEMLVSLSAKWMGVMIAVGCIVGFMTSTMMPDRASSALYALVGGFLVCSSTSFTMWQWDFSERGDLWIVHITSIRHGLNLGSKSNVLCLGVWFATAVFGFISQNYFCTPEEDEDESKMNSPLLGRGNGSAKQTLFRKQPPVSKFGKGYGGVDRAGAV